MTPRRGSGPRKPWLIDSFAEHQRLCPLPRHIITLATVTWYLGNKQRLRFNRCWLARPNKPRSPEQTKWGMVSHYLLLQISSWYYLKRAVPIFGMESWIDVVRLQLFHIFNVHILIHLRYRFSKVWHTVAFWIVIASLE